MVAAKFLYCTNHKDKGPLMVTSPLPFPYSAVSYTHLSFLNLAKRFVAYKERLSYKTEGLSCVFDYFSTITSTGEGASSWSGIAASRLGCLPSLMASTHSPFAFMGLNMNPILPVSYTHLRGGILIRFKRKNLPVCLVIF